MIKNKIADNDFFKKSYFCEYFSANPIGFIDVGARGGSHSLVEPLHSHVSFLGFEPDIQECDQLNENTFLKNHWSEFKILPHALGNDHSKGMLNIISSATNCSLLEPNSVFVDRYNMAEKWTVTGTCAVDLAPLDHVIFDLGLGFENSGEIIKLDTQGSEYEILEGANKLLSEKTVCVVTEVEFFQIYQDQKLFSDVELYLRKLGFSFYGFLTQHTRSKKALDKKTNLGKERLFYADAIFFKDPFSSSLDLTSRQYAVLLFSAMLTGFFDFALEIAASKTLNLSQAEYSYLKSLIDDLSRVDPIQTSERVGSLVNKINEDKQNTNLLLGKFVDAIGFPDFEDCRLSLDEPVI